VAGLRATTRGWLHISLSAGLAANKLVARIAARLRKPGAQVVVPPGEERAFLAPLSLRWLAGLDEAALSALDAAGVRTLGQFAALPAEALTSLLGRKALPLQRAAQGVSEEPVGAPRRRAEAFRESIEFEEDQWDTPLLLNALRRLAGRLMAGVRAAAAEIRQIALILRYTDREESRRTRPLAEPTALESDLDPLLPGLLAAAWTRRVRLRALTLEASRIYRPSAQMDLFGPLSPQRPAQLQLAAAIDRLRRLHGPAIIRRGWELAPTRA
jgi:DNA polymerase-4